MNSNDNEQCMDALQEHVERAELILQTKTKEVPLISSGNMLLKNKIATLRHFYLNLQRKVQVARKNPKKLKYYVAQTPYIGSILLWLKALKNIHVMRHDLWAMYESVSVIKKASSHMALPEEVYRELEDKFRSSFPLRQEYIDLISEAQVHTTGIAIDLGCGRGEWLQYLQQQCDLEVLGVDNNNDMIMECQLKGVKAVYSDILTCLKAQADNTALVISGFHIAEHLPAGRLYQLIQQAHRILKPGGVLILETPNPENVRTATYQFHLDPSHLHPLPPPLLDFLVKQVGFKDCQTLRFSAWPEYKQPQDLPEDIVKAMYCEQDYAVVAYKLVPDR